ncbi:unnamed protein product [Amoebophrya sp. A25]|nr:unnamed protein product [Amoebophrya sp. A25]|eukprot:GSA25T00011450001.1
MIYDSYNLSLSSRVLTFTTEREAAYFMQVSRLIHDESIVYRAKNKAIFDHTHYLTAVGLFASPHIWCGSSVFQLSACGSLAPLPTPW